MITANLFKSSLTRNLLFKRQVLIIVTVPSMITVTIMEDTPLPLSHAPSRPWINTP